MPLEEIIERLKRDKGGFGSRPCSCYSLGEHQEFTSYVLGLQPVRDLLHYTPTETVTDLSDEQQRRLKAVVDQVDRYGLLVRGWQGCRCSDWGQCRCVSTRCLDDLKLRLNFWARRNVPNDYQEKVAQVVASLLVALRSEITKYTYQEDLIKWAVPLLVKELWLQVEHVAQQSRPNVNLAQLRQKLQSAAQGILDRIRESYGIYGIEVDDVVERAVHFVMSANVEEYIDYRDKDNDEVFAWALVKLKNEIKLQVSFYIEPNMSHAWGLNQAKDRWEWQKRQTWLEVFCDPVP